jgi:hypothetical protein
LLCFFVNVSLAAIWQRVQAVEYCKPAAEIVKVYSTTIVLTFGQFLCRFIVLGLDKRLYLLVPGLVIEQAGPLFPIVHSADLLQSLVQLAAR